MSNMKSMVDEKLAKMEAQLGLWSAKVRELVAKADTKGQQAKIDSRKELDELKAKLEAARAKLDEAKAVGSEKWDVFKQGVEHAWDELEATFKKLVH